MTVNGRYGVVVKKTVENRDSILLQRDTKDGREGMARNICGVSGRRVNWTEPLLNQWHKIVFFQRLFPVWQHLFQHGQLELGDEANGLLVLRQWYRSIHKLAVARK